MNRIVLISCASKKVKHKAKAKDLYTSALFIHNLAYAQSLNPDKFFILSALHHLLDPETEIEPYDVTLSNVPKNKRKPGLKVLNAGEKKKWGEKVIEQLSRQTNLENDKFIILAGQEYIKPIIKDITHIEQPLAGFRQGERLKFLKKHVSNE
jgi:cytoplasmic iron level regulating protein YaaA (DUF328/UPF0246 family)